MDQVLQACSHSVVSLLLACIRGRALLENNHMHLEFYKPVNFGFSWVLDTASEVI